MAKLDADVIVIGGGIAGLACARTLHREGLHVIVIEGSDDIGGRIRTEKADGFLLDRGFQVLQTAYPEALNALDIKSLNLGSFDPGVIIRKQGKFYIIADPIRAPQYLFHTLFSPIGTFLDKWRIVRLYFLLRRLPLDAISKGPDMGTASYLKRIGFSHDMIHSFFRPFFSGVCLDPKIQVSSRVFEYIFRMFASGDAAIPENGMAAIPGQIAAGLPKQSIRTRSRVSSLTKNGVVTENGQTLFANRIVIATEAYEVQRLLGERISVSYFSEYCFYFSADQAPLPYNMLVLNGDGRGPIINLTFPSQASSSYAPPEKVLVAAIVIGENNSDAGELLNRATRQLQEWFGPVVEGWRHLKTFHIARALPRQHPPQPDPRLTNPAVRHNVYVCGEYQSMASIQWALYSGRKAAESILSQNRK